jgi:hypothetical protein
VAVLGAASSAAAQVANERTTANSSCVTVAVNVEAKTMTLKCNDADAPTTFMIHKDTLFVDAKGGVVPSETLANTPVTVQYTVEHDRMIANRVAADPR